MRGRWTKLILLYPFSFSKHPGGLHAILSVAGKDATNEFFGLHRRDVLDKFGPRLIIGSVANETPKLAPAAQAKTGFSSIPYAEIMDARAGFAPSPYYGPSHKKLRMYMREFVETYVRAEAVESEDAGQGPSKELWKKAAEAGIFLLKLGPGKHQRLAADLGFKLPCGIAPEEYDFFHEKIVTEELSRHSCPGFYDGLGTGITIGLPPVFNFGSDALKKKVVREILSGEKNICLAITEATAGSDVAGLGTTARLTEDGKHYIVNGHKVSFGRSLARIFPFCLCPFCSFPEKQKWITNGVWADYFTTAVRTDKGLTMLLIPRGEGVETKPIRTAYSAAAGTTYVTFDNVKVPVENVLGKVNEGLKVALSNFNHASIHSKRVGDGGVRRDWGKSWGRRGRGLSRRGRRCFSSVSRLNPVCSPPSQERWSIVIEYHTMSRVVLAECFKWAYGRKVFGKPLIDQPVIQNKLADMIAAIEADHAWIEQITHQMQNMTYEQMSDLLAGPIALLKYRVTRTGNVVADHSVQIFGGRGITKTGMGRVVETFYRWQKLVFFWVWAGCLRFGWF